MATFITLTLTSGHSIRVNSELMTSYSADVASFSEQCGSYVRMYEPYTDPAKYDFFVTETPEQIDKMLGVTERPAETYRKALEQIAEPLDFATCIGDPWDFYRDLQAVARDAIAAARGE